MAERSEHVDVVPQVLLRVAQHRLWSLIENLGTYWTMLCLKEMDGKVS